MLGSFLHYIKKITGYVFKEKKQLTTITGKLKATKIITEKKSITTKKACY